MLFYQVRRSGTSPEEIDAARVRLHHDARDDLLYLVYLGIATMALSYMYMAAWVYTGNSVTSRIRQRYLAAILRQDISYFDTVGVGEMVNRLESDTQLIQEGISDKVPISFMLLSTFVAGYVVAFVRSWKLTLVLMSILPCVLVTGAIMGSYVLKLQTSELDKVSKAANVAQEALSSVRTIKAFGFELEMTALYDTWNKTATTLGFRRSRIAGIGMGIYFFVIYSAYALAFFFGAKLVANGEIFAGNVISVILSVIMGTFSIAMLSPNLQALGYAASAAAKVFQIIDRPPAFDYDDPNGARLEHCNGLVKLEGVSFSYPARPDVPVLHQCSLTCAPKQVTALVGESGSGKSTVLSLLQRFYDPTEGVVLFDGKPVSEYNTQWLRSQIGFVTQEPILFATTIRKNIEYGLSPSNRDDLSLEEKNAMVVKAASIANAHAFIQSLPNGYDTFVGERGFLLSGGQKQRIAIARAVVRDPPLLLLDEATSALDAESESLVQFALESASKGRTTIVVAHRLSTIKNADNIIVMSSKGGHIMEQGTHTELLLRGNTYGSLVRAQRLLVQPKLENVEIGSSLAPTVKQLSVSGFSSYTNGKGEEMTGTTITLANDIESQTKFVTNANDSRSNKQRSMPYLFYQIARLNGDSTWSLFVPGAICGAAFGAAYPCFAILLGRSLSDMAPCTHANPTVCPSPANQTMRSAINREALWFFVIAILAALAIGTQTYCLMYSSVLLMERVRRKSFHKMLTLDTCYFDVEGHSSGTLSSSLGANASQINGLFGITMGSLIQSLSTLITGITIALIFGWKLSLVVIACIPVILVAGFIRLQLVVLKDVRVKAVSQTSSQRACEAISGIRTVASLNLQEKYLEMYRDDLQGPTSFVFKIAIYGNLLYALSQAVSFWITALAFWYGSHLLSNGEYTPLQFYTIFTAVVFGSIQASNAFNYAPDISAAKQAAAQCVSLLNTPNSLEAPFEIKTPNGEVPSDVTGQIQFDNVHFSYPSRPSVHVLQGLTIDISPGQSYALVGGSGSGKSTVIQLLERFYDPVYGRILLDGKDIKELSISEYRKHIAIVPQDPVMFEGSIAFNIMMGLQDAESMTMEAKMKCVYDAAKQANILAFVESLPDQFNTNVGHAGVQLSGGQKQRLALARALVRNPKILLLDEATSALDSESEKLVQNALKDAAKGRTTISIAHRLASIVSADQILCMQDGIVVQSGTHAELMATVGPYAKLVASQSVNL